MGVLLAGFHECFVHGLHGSQILIHNGVQCAVTLLDVADNTAENAHVGIGVYEYADVHFVTQLLVRKDQDPFYNDDLCRLNGDEGLAAVMHGVVVHGALNGLACLQLLEMLDHQLVFKCIGMVIIELAALFVGYVVMRFIVIVVVDNGYISAEPFHDSFGNGGFAGTGTAGNANGQNIAHRCSLRSSLLVFHSNILSDNMQFDFLRECPYNLIKIILWR